MSKCLRQLQQKSFPFMVGLQLQVTWDLTVSPPWKRQLTASVIDPKDIGGAIAIFRAVRWPLRPFPLQQREAVKTPLRSKPIRDEVADVTALYFLSGRTTGTCATTLWHVSLALVIAGLRKGRSRTVGPTGSFVYLFFRRWWRPWHCGTRHNLWFWTY